MLPILSAQYAMGAIRHLKQPTNREEGYYTGHTNIKWACPTVDSNHFLKKIFPANKRDRLILEIHQVTGS